MRRRSLSVALVAAAIAAALAAGGACGRFGFDATPRADAGHDAEQPGITVVADWSTLNPYDSMDFGDGSGFADNAPAAVASLTAPFDEGFVVSVGRKLIELPSGRPPVVHDYRPAMANGAGPDAIVVLASGALPGFSGIYAGATSTTAGDGVYRIDTSWQITRDHTENNVAGLAVDATGAFDGLGAPALYFAAGNMGVLRRDSATTSTQIVAFPKDVGSIAISASYLYVVESDGDGFPSRLWRIRSVDHVQELIDTAMGIMLAEGSDPSSGLVAIREQRQVVRYRPGGAFDVLATAPDASTLWLDLTIPRAPHALAGRIVVLEWNTDTDTQRLVMLPP